MEHEEEVDGGAVAEASSRYGIPVADILAVITHESRGKADANAGAAQRDHGRRAASGLMQVTAATWAATQQKHAELSEYAFEATATIGASTSSWAPRRSPTSAMR